MYYTTLGKKMKEFFQKKEKIYVLHIYMKWGLYNLLQKDYRIRQFELGYPRNRDLFSVYVPVLFWCYPRRTLLT